MSRWWTTLAVLLTVSTMLSRYLDAILPRLPFVALGQRCFSTISITNPPVNNSPDDLPEGEYEPPINSPTYIVRKKGMELLHDPWYNKVRSRQGSLLLVATAARITSNVYPLTIIWEVVITSTSLARKERTSRICHLNLHQQSAQRPSPPSLQGTAFPMAERERLGLRGLIPPRVLTLEIQVCAFKTRTSRIGATLHSSSLQGCFIDDVRCFNWS